MSDGNRRPPDHLRWDNVRPLGGAGFDCHFGWHGDFFRRDCRADKIDRWEWNVMLRVPLMLWVMQQGARRPPAVEEW